MRALVGKDGEEERREKAAAWSGGSKVSASGGVIVRKAGLEHEARVGEETFRRWNGKGRGWRRGRLLERSEACKFGERGIRDVAE